MWSVSLRNHGGQEDGRGEGMESDPTEQLVVAPHQPNVLHEFWEIREGNGAAGVRLISESIKEMRTGLLSYQVHPFPPPSPATNKMFPCGGGFAHVGRAAQGWMISENTPSAGFVATLHLANPGWSI